LPTKKLYIFVKFFSFIASLNLPSYFKFNFDCFCWSMWHIHLSTYKEHNVTANELKNWKLLGKGTVSNWETQVSLKEAAVSKGITVISPKTEGGNIILKDKILALTPATVTVNMLSVSDIGETESLTIPTDYDGSFGLRTKQKQRYFIAFKNTSHNVTSFIKNIQTQRCLFSLTKITLGRQEFNTT